MGCDRRLLFVTECGMIFQSTHPSGVRPQRLWERALIAYFNPRTPVGCDVVGCHLAVVHGDISIHAPQWGATQHHHHLGAGDQISIHAPQWGATQKSHSIRRNRHHFNPRTPVGCDKPMVDQITEMYEFQSTHPSGVRPGGQGSNAQATSISIHAPQWGATRLVFPPVRRDGFQSTHPSGVRPNGTQNQPP